MVSGSHKIPGMSPRDKEQARNIARRINANVAARDELHDIYALGRSIPRQFTIILELSGFLQMGFGLTSLLDHAEEIISSMGKTVLHYDTTFKVGPFYTSILTWRHNGFKTNPLIPLAMLFHEAGDTEAHYEFFRKLVGKVPALNTAGNVIVTDRELSIRKALRRLPNVKNFLCWNHLRKVILA